MVEWISNWNLWIGQILVVRGARVHTKEKEKGNVWRALNMSNGNMPLVHKCVFVYFPCTPQAMAWASLCGQCAACIQLNYIYYYDLAIASNGRVNPAKKKYCSLMVSLSVLFWIVQNCSEFGRRFAIIKEWRFTRSGRWANVTHPIDTNHTTTASARKISAKFAIDKYH